MSLTEATKEGLLSHVLHESPFASVSTVSRGHPSQVSLVTIKERINNISLPLLLEDVGGMSKN